MTTTETARGSYARLLIGEYDSIDDIGCKILYSPWIALDLDKPALRFRGTVVDARGGLDRIRITGWQRNVSRLRKMDVSLPTIISLTLDSNGTIVEAVLDGSFKGSKGLMCCHPYLDRNLKSILPGRSFDSGFIRLVKQEKTLCAHVFEVLAGMCSYFRIIEANGFKDIEPRSYACEEEAIDSFVEGGTLRSFGRHVLEGKPCIDYRLDLADVVSSVRFSRNGVLESARGINVCFAINETPLLKDTVAINNPGLGHSDLAGFLLRCVGALKNVACPALKLKVFNTNLHPRAYMGMLVQSIAIRIFNNNYNYIMHALTALQRSNGAPLCVGAIADQEEADEYFPGYSFSELV